MDVNTPKYWNSWSTFSYLHNSGIILLDNELDEKRHCWKKTKNSSSSERLKKI